MLRLGATVLALLIVAGAAGAQTTRPFVVVLGVAQDAGVPQAGADGHSAWEDAELRRGAASLGLVGAGDRYWLFEATPDLRVQLHALAHATPKFASLAGVFITHAHVGHYAGLMFFGHESMGATEIPVHVMPRMANFLEQNGRVLEDTGVGVVIIGAVIFELDADLPGRQRALRGSGLLTVVKNRCQPMPQTRV